MSVFTSIISIKDDFLSWTNGDSEINPDVFLHPAKYSTALSIKKIVADNKVSKQGIDLYKEKIKQNQKIDPIIVVKHPRKDLYAVLDGHHRYYAYLELGRKEINCVIAGNYSSVIFYLTQHGYFQPTSQFTENVRHPIVRFHENLKQFLNNFLSNGNKKNGRKV